MDTGAFESSMRTFESFIQMVSTVLPDVVRSVHSAGGFVGGVLGGGSAGQYGMTETGRYVEDPTYLPGVSLAMGHSATTSETHSSRT